MIKEFIINHNKFNNKYLKINFKNRKNLNRMMNIKKIMKNEFQNKKLNLVKY